MSTGRLFSISARRNGAIISQISSSLRGKAGAGVAAASKSQTQNLFGGISTQRWLSSYPAHEVVGMPSLSPVRDYERAYDCS